MPFPGISFVTDQAGRRPFRCYLDVPPMNYGDGYRFGLSLAAELSVAAERLPHVPLQQILTECALELEATQADSGKGSQDRRGAAVAILTSVCHAYVGACKVLNHRHWHAERIRDHERMQHYEDRQRAARKADFVTRMRAAKAAKAGQRQTEGATAGGAL